MTSNNILWITTFIMAAGGLLILVTGKRRTPLEGLQTILHGVIPLIAACLYLAMASGEGSVILPTDTAVRIGTHATRIFYFARYIDWTFTTPLLLLTLGLTAMHNGVKQGGALVGAVLFDVIMIATAFAFGAAEVDWIKWTWFVISCISFLGVYYIIWVWQAQANLQESSDVQAAYRRDAFMLSAVWLIYPIILAVSPDGGNKVGNDASVLVIAILDVIAKVIFGFIASKSDEKLVDADLHNATILRKAA